MLCFASTELGTNWLQLLVGWGPNSNQQVAQFPPKAQTSWPWDSRLL